MCEHIKFLIQSLKNLEARLISDLASLNEPSGRSEQSQNYDYYDQIYELGPFEFFHPNRCKNSILQAELVALRNKESNQNCASPKKRLYEYKVLTACHV